ncbi:hypothetical protein [Paenibacillus ginsengarvi]|uniref:Uncharacterized protein n=1 Tax=Paenibacillus ginsengarvi TaxID=400777 RepID=A0A3B0CRP1_9BACL|nr:hypothetical protein [Paenibacillus ginsengarvi]RKN86770.1 hypothetical protein D7M11_02085 [Paenibacillus ginsengarvi]
MGQIREEMPEICKDCPEKRWCSLDPEMWQCEIEPVEALQGEVEIACYDCEKGFTVSYERTGLPEQEVCQLCNGAGKIMVNRDFAEALQGEDTTS